MKTTASLVLLASLAACGGAAERATTTTTTPAAQPSLQIKLTTVYVDDQDKALRFYTEVLGFEKKEDASNGGFRWLTVTAPGDADGPELLLALDADPAAKAFQEALYASGQPATMLYTDDIEAVHARLVARGATFTMPPTEVPPFATIATLDDTCGNLLQITELH